MKNYNAKLKSLQSWLEHNKTELVFLIGVLLLAGFLRLWKIDQYLPFLGDEGRDVRVVRRFLINFDLMFIGPRTSIGDMYLGPLYYYLVAPFLWLWHFSPTGPAVFVALLSVATVFLIWWVAREWFGPVAALISALLYSISPLVIEHSQHSWNPNIMPFFSLLAVYSIWRVWQSKEFKWLLVLGFSFGAILQSHYLGLLLLPTAGIVWLLTWKSTGNWKLETGKSFFIYSLISILLFLSVMSPLFLFDYKHGWHNLYAVKTFFTDRQETVSAKPWNAIPGLWPLWAEQVVTRLVVAGDAAWGKWIAPILVILGLIVGHRFYKKNEKTSLNAIRLIGLWIGVGLVGLGLYKQHIYDHYFGFLFPAPFLVIGAISQEIWNKSKWVVIVLFVVATWWNLKSTPLLSPPQQQMQRTQEIDQKIIQESGGRPFNLGLIAERNYEEGYLYFFELWGAPVKEIDPQNLQQTLTGQLFVVCEDPVCEPINHPKAEIANFGWAKIENQWEVRGLKIFKLVHTK